MFQGFSPETVDFLWGIRMNNNRAWFEANKQAYNQFLYNPMKGLGAAVYGALGDLPETELKVSRIYRDARMHPPVPYKESLWFCVRRAGAYWAQNPTLYFEIRPEGASFGFSLWEPGTETMEAFRRSLAARPEDFPSLLEEAQARSGLTLVPECYKRPRPCDNPAIGPYFQWRRHLDATRELFPGEELFSPELPELVAGTLRPWLPVCRYLDRLITAAL